MAAAAGCAPAQKYFQLLAERQYYHPLTANNCDYICHYPFLLSFFSSLKFRTDHDGLTPNQTCSLPSPSPCSVPTSLCLDHGQTSKQTWIRNLDIRQVLLPLGLITFSWRAKAHLIFVIFLHIHNFLHKNFSSQRSVNRNNTDFATRQQNCKKKGQILRL